MLHLLPLLVHTQTGMMWTLIIGTLWLGVASYYELNVSSTHSIIGGIIGFAIAAKGSSGVLWITHDPTAFPPYKVPTTFSLRDFISLLL